MKPLRRALLLLLSLGLLTGCVSSPAPITPGGQADASVTPDQPARPSIQEVSLLAVPLTAPADADAAFAGFGLRLLRAARTEGENTLLSPLSAALALGMTANGAQGDTLAQFEALFGMEIDGLNAFLAHALADYGSLGGSTESTLANSLWADPDAALTDPFILRCTDVYQAQLFAQDLQDAAAPKAVNGWVKEATHGLIPSVADKFSDDAVLALVNALYLKNAFQSPFLTPFREWTMDFYNADGSVSQPVGMSNGQRMECYVNLSGAQGVILPYDDGRLGLLLLLPREGVSLTQCLAALDGDAFTALAANGRQARTELRVPKFETQWAGSLAPVLAQMGLTDAFDGDRADFSLMGTTKDGTPLCIGDVIHKTVFKLNEKGTEAAAVTAVMMDAASAMPPDDLVYLTFDHPFLYGIVDLETGAPLFLGTLEKL